jgi:hypothetical protein
MAHRVDASVERVQAPRSDAVVDRALPEPQRRELSPRYHAVLASRYGGDRPVTTWLTFSLYVSAKVSHPRWKSTEAQSSVRFRTRR